MATNTGTLKTSGVGQQTGYTQTGQSSVANIGQFADLRRLHDFSDRVAELTPEESPFFVYLSKMAKRPTTDPVFRFLENRSRIDWTTRSFVLGAAVNGGSAVSVDTNYSFTVADAATPAASIDWLIKGMVFVVETADGNDTGGDSSDVAPAQVMVRVESAPVDAGTTTTFTGRVISLSASGAGADYNVLADDYKCQVIGTSFEEGSGSPDVWSSQLEDDFGYTQIFKTAAEMTNTAIATNYRGYANEWDRIWALKLREHKVDIERAMLFGQRARSGGIQYTEGLVGHCLVNQGTATASGSLSYASGKPYVATQASTAVTYDSLLSDFEVMFDPARGGSSSKLALASLPVVSFFNKIGGFADATTSLNAEARYNFNAQERSGAFGHKIMEIDTIHGSVSLVKEPLFRGLSSGFMLMADMNNVGFRPLVGNGLNRDTHIITNVQQADEDLRKDMIITEAGLEVSLPETHALYNFNNL